MRVLFKRLVIFSFVVLCVGHYASASTDVRILIDVSGSMKQNDPLNLRIPAVRLVAELMPAGAIAGIWAFSETVEPLLAPQPVDSQWKKRANTVSAGIHSRGQFTDIEAALKVATLEWDKEVVAESDRHVILLTDGVVDVSKDATASAQSRNRILGPVLKRLQAQGARLHTIALSENSDHELLKILAESSEGWSKRVNSAAALQRTFLHMFEQATSPDTLPLLDNRFEVDGSVREMTLLVFNRVGAEPLKLVSPDGETIDAGTDKTNIKWQQEDGYELVTVSLPRSGTWQINTDPDPDNRVLIVTDLKLAVDPLPASMLRDESVDLRAVVTDRGAIVERRDFLELITADVLVSGGSAEIGTSLSMPLSTDSSEFKHSPIVEWAPGDYEFIVRINGGTFKREKRSKVRIHNAPLMFSSKVLPDGQTIQLNVNAEPDLIDVETTNGFLLVNTPDDSMTVLDLPPFSGSDAEIVFPAPLNGVYRIQPKLLTRTKTDRILTVNAAPLLTEITQGEALQSAPPELVVEPLPLPPKVDWLKSLAFVLIGNVVVGAFVAVLWVAMGTRKTVPASQVVLQ